MYAGVKFHCDNTVSVVPINHIKNFKLPVETKAYQVFWSKNPEEGPNSSHKNVDKIFKSLSSRKDEKTSLPPNGYYNAKILCIADTLEETEESLNSLGLPLKKRSDEKISKASARKLISSAASSVVRSSILENSLAFSDDEDDTDADETVEPVRSYKEKLLHAEFENTKLEKENENLKSQLILAKEQLKRAEEQSQNFSEKVVQTKEKYKNLKEEYKIVRQLNYELQRKFISSVNVVSPNLNELNYAHSSKLVQEPSSPSLISSNESTLDMSNLLKRKRPAADIASQAQQSPSTSELNNIDSLMISQEMVFPIAAEPTMQENYMFLSDDLIKSSFMGCRNGKDGDKVYVKNLAVNLFGKNLLMNSSATGRKPPTGGQTARPALPKAGIVYIRNLLEQRVLSELNPRKDLTEDEKKIIVDQRSSFIIVNQAIGDKIASLRRIKS